MALFGAGLGLLLFAVANADGGPANAAVAPAVTEVRAALAFPGSDEVLELSLFAMDDGTTEAARRIAVGKAEVLAGYPGAVELEPAEVAAQYALYGIRWREPTATWWYNPAGETNAMQPPAALNAIIAGSVGWEGAGDTPWRFDYAGQTTTPTGCNGVPEAIPRDGKNVVGWGPIAGGFLGFACWWRSGSLVEGTPYFEALEFDIVFEPIFAYTPQTLRALALHEFGHALGLEHTDAQCPGAAMCAGAHAMLFTEPQADDLEGLVALYGLAPTPGSPTPTATPPLPSFPKRSTLPALARD